MLEGDRIDYKSAEKARGPRLEVPPDLTQLQRDNRYAIPEANKGVATASGYQLEQQNKPTTDVTVAPTSKGDEIRIERDGSQRWLVVKQTPEQLWPQIKDFWQDSGFLINIESPDTGVMETDWAENRAKIPQDFIRNTLGKVLIRCTRPASATSSAPAWSAAPTAPPKSSSAIAVPKKC
jgi:outer membrane protein assembly factor BamC